MGRSFVSISLSRGLHYECRDPSRGKTGGTSRPNLPVVVGWSVRAAAHSSTCDYERQVRLHDEVYTPGGSPGASVVSPCPSPRARDPDCVVTTSYLFTSTGTDCVVDTEVSPTLSHDKDCAFTWVLEDRLPLTEHFMYWWGIRWTRWRPTFSHSRPDNLLAQGQDGWVIVSPWSPFVKGEGPGVEGRNFTPTAVSGGG